ncbi:MAG: terminase large subunit domain-containing protein [Natronosporangium sp.]
MAASDLVRLRDVGVFAGRLIGESLWPHQLEVATSPARFRCICAGRQVGKSRTLAVVALHAAFCTAGLRVLVVSAGDDASKDLLAQVSALASSPWLGGSVAADDSTRIVLSNGSVIRCVPASTKQIRGKSVDLLIVDEAAFVSEEIWSAARYTILARPGSRVVLSSTPFGRRSGWFATLWRLGLSGEAGYESWHWPSTVSPLVDRELIEQWRRTDNPRTFRREVEAEWLDDAGAYFTAAELELLADDYDLIEPTVWSRRAGVVAGVDWGFADASTLVVVAGDVPAKDGRARYWVPWLVERFAMPYDRFIEDVVLAAAGVPSAGSGYPFYRVVAESNGVGQMPAQILGRRLWELERRSVVEAFHTTAQSKEDSFGLIKLLAQQQRLRIPRHPGLLGQLEALEFETSESGSVRIAVPESRGHDDLAMGLALAVTPIQDQEMVPTTAEIVEVDDLLDEADLWEYEHERQISPY